MVKPFGVPQLVHSHCALEEQQIIHVLVPVSAAVLERFQEFLLRYEDNFLYQKNQMQLYLMVILFVDSHSKNKDELVRVLMTSLQRRYRTAHIRLIQTTRPFSRALALDLGSKQLPNNILMFFCDVDVWFNGDFLDRCRENTVQYHRVYYPIMFAQYNPDIVSRYSNTTIKNFMQINSNTGE